jgi:hypothetical protein
LIILVTALALIHVGSELRSRPAAPDPPQFVPSPAELRVHGPGLSATLAFANDTGGLLSISDTLTKAPLATGLASSVHVADGRAYHFPMDFAPADPLGFATSSVRDPIQGPAQRLTAAFVSTDGELAMNVEILVSQGAPVLVYQLHVRPRQPTPLRFALLHEPSGHMSLHAPVEYLSILSPGHVARRLEVTSGATALPLPPASPLLLWSDMDGRGFVIGTLDEVSGASFVTAALSGPDAVHLGINTGPLASDATSSPRVYLELTTRREPAHAFAGFRSALDVLAPLPPVPSSFRHQWDSWYVFAGAIDEEVIKRQIDAIAARYGDLGPWQVVIDAGWYRAGADPDGELGLVDEDRFPSGMRALVDYAHQQGVGVLLYAAAPWVDNRPSEESWWMVQQGFVREHKDWLILVDEHEDGATYVYDLQNPELRAYLDRLIRRYLVEFDADGILLDMVGIIGERGGPLVGAPPAPGQRSTQAFAQTMEVYRFFWESATRHKPSAWIEGGYAAPPLTRRYAQTWRYADTYPAFASPYPFGGLREQLTFGALQEQMLGRRAHLGYIYGDDTTWPVQQQWLAAAVAMQRQVALSTDLAALPPEIMRMYREYLTALRPFSTQPVYGPGIPPEWFFTHVNGTSYLGLLNPGEQPKEVALSLAEIGFTGSEHAIAFDPRSREALALSRRFAIPVPGLSFRLLAIRSEPGVLWSDRDWTSAVDGTDLVVHVQSAPVADGRVWIYPGRARSIFLDGVPQAIPARRDRVIALSISDGESHELRLRR